MAHDPRIDAIIDKANDFAKPILRYWRELVHQTVPGVEETLKWSMPHFVYKGKNIAAMAPFKDQFSDAEIAAVVTYVRNSWGNKASDVQAAEVKARRK